MKLPVCAKLIASVSPLQPHPQDMWNKERAVRSIHLKTSKCRKQGEESGLDISMHGHIASMAS